MCVGTSVVTQKRLGWNKLSQVGNTLRLISVVLNWMIITTLMLSYCQKQQTTQQTQHCKTVSVSAVVSCRALQRLNVTNLKMKAWLAPG